MDAIVSADYRWLANAATRGAHEGVNHALAVSIPRLLVPRGRFGSDCRFAHERRSGETRLPTRSRCSVAATFGLPGASSDVTRLSTLMLLARWSSDAIAGRALLWSGAAASLTLVAKSIRRGSVSPQGLSHTYQRRTALQDHDSSKPLPELRHRLPTPSPCWSAKSIGRVSAGSPVVATRSCEDGAAAVSC